MTSWRAALADLVAGARCGGCDVLAVPLCADCRAVLLPEPRPVSLDGSRPLPGRQIAWASGEYAGPLRRVVARYKDEGRFGLLPLLSSFLAAAVVVAADGDRPPALVPVPSSRAAVRRRGHDTVRELAVAARGRLRAIGLDAVVVPGLRQVRPVADQVGLGRRERASNLHGALGLTTSASRLTAGRTIVVVDDVVTTGATLREAMRALGDGGLEVHGAACVAATPHPDAGRP